MVVETARIAHAVLTRFNLPSAGIEGTVRAREGWLRSRLELFETYTLPAMRGQIDPPDTWLIYFDPESPDWLKSAIDRHVAEGRYVALFRESVPSEQLAKDLASHLPEATMLLTTNLDNDDSIAYDFGKRLHQLAPVSSAHAVFFRDGLIRAGARTYLRRDPDNAFCSVLEPWSQQPSTCWLDWHNLLSSRMPTIVLDGDPAWLQMIHDGNVSNRVRGRVVDPTRFQPLFGHGLSGAQAPRLRRRAADFAIHRPLRNSRDAVRTLGKKIVLQAGGKEQLDRLKMMTSRRAR
ncbi:glycosyltransferase [Actinopolymorpha sp. NPDC004070]|uniref:glycosyltransferase n=1 Tax=Actinopolymorpha sp. NPDC004070 TaxID=3154548 RepID=UPI0033A97F00